MQIQVNVYLAFVLAVCVLPVFIMAGDWTEVTDNDAANLALVKQIIQRNVIEDYQTKDKDASVVGFSFSIIKKEVDAGLIYQENFSLEFMPNKSEDWTAQVIFNTADKSPNYTTNGYPKCVDLDCQ